MAIFFFFASSVRALVRRRLHRRLPRRALGRRLDISSANLSSIAFAFAFALAQFHLRQIRHLEIIVVHPPSSRSSRAFARRRRRVRAEVSCRRASVVVVVGYMASREPSKYTWVDSIGPIDRIFETTRARAQPRRRRSSRSSRSSEGASAARARVRVVDRRRARGRARRRTRRGPRDGCRAPCRAARAPDARANANANARAGGRGCACFARRVGAEVEDARRPWTRGRIADGFRSADAVDGGWRTEAGARRRARRRARRGLVCYPASTPKLVVFSGGTAMNMIADELADDARRATRSR